MAFRDCTLGLTVCRGTHRLDCDERGPRPAGPRRVRASVTSVPPNHYRVWSDQMTIGADRPPPGEQGFFRQLAAWSKLQSMASGKILTYTWYFGGVDNQATSGYSLVPLVFFPWHFQTGHVIAGRPRNGTTEHRPMSVLLVFSHTPASATTRVGLTAVLGLAPIANITPALFREAGCLRRTDGTRTTRIIYAL